ncbi:MAG: helix-turn-helix domain-containing protein [Candidatus Aminicenantales bacterium]
MKSNLEYDRRCRAIRLLSEGVRFKEVLNKVQRGRFWLSKWIRRYKAFGLDGLRDRSRTPKHIRNRTRGSLIRKILALRDELAAHKTRRAAFTGIGAETIHYELHDRGVRHLPVISTIEKILARAGKTKKVKVKRTPGGPPYPYVRARKMGDHQQTDLVGPRYLRGPLGITRFYSFHTIDVVGQTVSAHQFLDRQTISFFRHLIESWRVMGLPRVSQMDNEMAASGGGRYRYSLSQVIRLHLLFGIHLVFIPKGEPGRNATVESFNNTWQMRVLRHRCANLRAVRRCSDRFLEYYHVRKPSRSLTVADYGTRFPGVLRNQLWPTLRHLPIGFTIDPYFDARGHPALPIAKGLVSWVRKVDAHGCIEFNGAEYFIRRKLERQYVVATLSTHHRTVYIKHDGKLVKTLPFPFTGRIIKPLC